MRRLNGLHAFALSLVLGGSCVGFAAPKKIQIKFHVAFVDVPASDTMQITYDDVTPADQAAIADAVAQSAAKPPLPAWSILVDDERSLVGVQSASIPTTGNVRIQLTGPLGTDAVSKHQITVLFAGDPMTGVQPETVAVKQPKSAAASGPWFLPKVNFTTDKKDANLDIAGSLQTGVGAKPQYQWSVQAKYPIEYEGSNFFFKVGPQFTSTASQQPNADPDSMGASAVTEFDFSKQLSSDKNLPINVSFNPIDYEFERKAQQEAILENGKPALHSYQQKNTNLIVSGQVQLVEAWWPVNLNINLSTEVGSAVSRSVLNATPKPGYSDNPLRAVAAADVYFNVCRHGKAPPLCAGREAGKPLLNVDGHYTVRSPFHPEPFKEAGVNSGNEFYSTKARHYIAVNLARTLAKGSNLTVQYRYGSLPPTFSFVDHQVTIGFEVVLGK